MMDPSAPNPTTPHERLREARKAAGYTSTAAFAQAFDLVEGTVRSHENGNRGLRPPAAALYARLLNVSAAWLLTGDGEPTAALIPGPVDRALLRDVLGALLPIVAPKCHFDPAHFADLASLVYEHIADEGAAAKRVGTSPPDLRGLVRMAVKTYNR